MKPIFTKFFGDTERAKTLMPKARARIKHLAEKGGEFFGGVRIDRSLWDDVEITVFEYEDLYVIRIEAPEGPGKRDRQGGVWCIPIKDWLGTDGGYDRLGDPITDRLIVGPNGSDIWNPEGSWSYMTLDPDDSVRGVVGPLDDSVFDFIPATSLNPSSLDPLAQFYGWPSYGLCRRGNTYSWHAPSNSYLSWDMGWKDVAHLGFTQDDIDNGRIQTHTSRYFGIPSGKVLYWKGHILGTLPNRTTTVDGGDRFIIGAGLVGGDVGSLTVIAVLGEFTEDVYGTYLDQFNSVRKSLCSVWKRSFDGNENPDATFDGREAGWVNPETGEVDEGGWIKLGDVDIPAQWDLQSTVTNKNLNGDAYTSWYTRYSRFQGTACWNEQPKTRLDGSPIYEFSGPLMHTAGLEYDSNNDPGDFPVRAPLDQGTEIEAGFQFCGNDLVASFYTITLNEDLTGISVLWEDVMVVPETNTLPELCSPFGMEFDPILRGMDDTNGWVKGAIDYRFGDKTYLEHRAFYDNSKYPEWGQHQLELNWGNRVNQFRWNGHSFTGSRSYFFDDGSAPDGSSPPFQYDVDQKEFFFMGLDLRHDVAWVCEYYAQKRRETVPLDPEYYNTFVGQNLSHYLVQPIDPADPNSGTKLTNIYNEIDGGQSLGPYNLAGDIAVPASPFTTLGRDLDDPYGLDTPCTEIKAITWIDNIHPGAYPVGVNAYHFGEQASNRHVRLAGDRPVQLQDAGRIQHSKIGFGVCHNGDVFIAKVASVYGFAGTGYGDTPEWTGVQYVIRPASPNDQQCIMWDSLNGLNSYVETFNCPDNDQDCYWLGVIG